MEMQRTIATIICHMKCLKTYNSSSTASKFSLIYLEVSSATDAGRHDVRNLVVSIFLAANFEQFGVYVVGWQSGVSPFCGQVATQTAAL
jgi:hypothetical protein